MGKSRRPWLVRLAEKLTGYKPLPDNSFPDEENEDTICISSLRKEIARLSEQCELQKETIRDLEQKKSPCTYNPLDLAKKVGSPIINCLQGSELFEAEFIDKSKVLKYFETQLTAILKSLGIDVYEDCGVPFNSTFHKIEATTPSPQKELVGRISQSLGRGYRYGEYCIVEQPVEVYK